MDRQFPETVGTNTSASMQSLPGSVTPGLSVGDGEQNCSPNEEPPTVAESTGGDDLSTQYEPISADNAAELRRLASLDSIHRRGSLEHPDAGATTDPELDPASPRFDIYKWTRMILTSMDEEQIPIQQTGFCFKDLNVYGSGPS